MYAVLKIALPVARPSVANDFVMNSEQINLSMSVPGLQTEFTEYYQAELRHWRTDNSIIQRGIERDWIRANPQEYDCSAWKNAWIRR